MTAHGLYVHIPFCDAKCAYCDFVSFPKRKGDFLAYVEALVGEARLREPLPLFTSVFFGGGTPSILPPAAIPRLLGALGGHISPSAEITCEANPGSLTAEHVRLWRQAGVNRLSLGAQAAQPDLLRAIGRRHAWRDVEDAAALWGDGDSLSLDLMHGLPGQSPEAWEETLRAALLLRPGHLSCYALTLEPGTPLHQQAEEGKLRLPDPDAYDPQEAATRLLGEAGLARYEVSNYAMPGRECRHNLLYWHRGDYIGLGCAAHSLQHGVRSANVDDLDAYLQSIGEGRLPTAMEEALSQEDAWFEELMLGLRLVEGVQLSPGAFAHYEKRLRMFAKQDLLTLQDRHAAATPRGMDVLNSLLVALDEG